MGYFTNRIPIEILHAIDTIPIRILSLGSSIQGASEQYIQSFACSWLRRIIDIGLNNGFNDLNGVIFSTGTCDSLQNVSDIWRKIFPNQISYNIAFPVLMKSESATLYLQNEFVTLVRNITDDSSANTNELSLSKSIQLYNKKRIHLQKLATYVSNRRFRYKEFFKLLTLCDVIPVEHANQILRQEINKIEAGNSLLDIPETPRILLTGGMFDNPRLIEEINEFNHVVVDDLSFGTRNFDFTIPQSSSLKDYSKTYLDRIPDPTVFDTENRWNSLKKSIHNYKVDAVILLGIKFCDPEMFEFIFIQNELKNLGIPFLVLETSPGISNLLQIQTRLTAFIEMLS